MPRQTTWTFDRLDTIGGLPVKVDGHPKVIETPLGKAVAFDGVDDSIYIDQHPLAGAEQFTFEAIFRPDGGATEQRWFHLAERNPSTGQLITLTAAVRRMRTPVSCSSCGSSTGNRWCLDAFVAGPGYSRALLFRRQVTSDRGVVSRRFHVRRENVPQLCQWRPRGEAELAFRPQGPGGTSVGTRVNHVNYFNGAVRQARFTPRALPPDQFLKMPSSLCCWHRARRSPRRSNASSSLLLLHQRSAISHQPSAISHD